MIGRTQNNIDPEESKAKIALRDAAVIGLLNFVSGLLAFGYPPTPEVLYMTGLTALLTGIVSYMHALGIKKPQE